MVIRHKKQKKINSRSKGQRAERDVADKFTKWWGSKFFRTPGSGSLATMGFKHEHLNMSGDICCEDSQFPFCVEIKHHERWDIANLFNEKNPIMQWWQQAVDAAVGCDKVPLLIFKKNHSQMYVMFEPQEDDPVPGQYIIFVAGSGKEYRISLLNDFLDTEPKAWIGRK